MTTSAATASWGDYESALGDFIDLIPEADRAKEEADRDWHERESAQQAEYARQHSEAASIKTAVEQARVSVRQAGDQLAVEPADPGGVTDTTSDQELLQRLRDNDRRLRALFAALPGLRARRAESAQNRTVVTVWAVITGVTALIALASGPYFLDFFAALFNSAIGAAFAIIPVVAGNSWLFRGLAGGKRRGTGVAYRLSMGCALVPTSVLHISSYGLLILIISAALVLINGRRLRRVLSSRV